MLHVRTWYISEVTSVDEATRLLKQYQNECFGMRFGDLLFLNDSTDTGFTEYAVIEEKRGVQIDSWTLNWMGNFEVERSLRKIVDGHSSMEEFPTYTGFKSNMIVNKPLN